MPLLLAACAFGPAVAYEAEAYKYHIKFAVELGGYSSGSFGAPDKDFGTLASDTAGSESTIKYDFKASVADALGIPGDELAFEPCCSMSDLLHADPCLNCFWICWRLLVTDMRMVKLKNEGTHFVTIHINIRSNDKLLIKLVKRNLVRSKSSVCMMQ
jgi:hypothetical protein